MGLNKWSCCLKDYMLLNRVDGPSTILGLELDMVYGPSSIACLVVQADIYFEILRRGLWGIGNGEHFFRGWRSGFRLGYSTLDMLQAACFQKGRYPIMNSFSVVRSLTRTPTIATSTFFQSKRLHVDPEIPKLQTLQVPEK